MTLRKTKTLTPTLSRRTGRGSSELDITAATGRSYLLFLRRVLARVCKQTRAPRDLSFALVGDATMSRLHKQFMAIQGPTDVLTFELDHDARGRVTSGEVIVCVPEARRQARRHGTKVEHELLLYCLHGILHLTGHDDLDDAAHRKMHRAEDRILTAIGIGPVFRPVQSPPRPPLKKKSNQKKESPRR
jgi:probable rRNA maturation factor